MGAMGTPSSSLITEIFLQHTEHLHMAHLTHRHRIIIYFRYADDIFLIFDPNHTNIQTILDDFNTLHPRLLFTADVDRDNTINYLDISIHRTPNNLKTSIHTFTDTIMPYTSNHPTQHKYAAVKFLFNRLNSCDLQKEEYRHELNIFHNILHYNSFPIRPQKPPIQTPAQRQTSPTPKSRWAIFAYVSKEASYIGNVFRRTDLKITFRTNSTIKNLLTHKT